MQKTSIQSGRESKHALREEPKKRGTETEGRPPSRLHFPFASWMSCWSNTQCSAGKEPNRHVECCNHVHPACTSRRGLAGRLLPLPPPWVHGCFAAPSPGNWFGASWNLSLNLNDHRLLHPITSCLAAVLQSTLDVP